MTRQEVISLTNYLSTKTPLTVKEVSLLQILKKDNNLYRVEDTLRDHPDLRGLAFDILEVL